ncbi:hypothetical protein APA_789 [Pseudanabaena sp. lw0831]|nr:hypothetical protein APA_789 [Pseudanabaena sp. lw0831]
MPSVYQKASLNAILGLFLEAQGHPYPEHTEVKSASALSRFLNHYNWSTRGLIRATRQAILGQIGKHRPAKQVPFKDIDRLDHLRKMRQVFTFE